jgi:hypothetical protein
MKQLTISILVILSLYSSSQPMSGTYTIGSGGYFVSINQAIDSLQAKGIGGPVVLNVLPGIYNESLKFDSINGTNAFNTITLQAANGDSSSVVITHTASTYSNTIISTNISNIIINKITLLLDISNFGGIIIFISNDNAVISNCVIKSTNNSTVNTCRFIHASETNNIEIKNNYISGRMEYGIYHFSNQSNYYSNIRIEHNTIENLQTSPQPDMVMWLVRLINCKVIGNTIIRGKIRMYDISGDCQFTKNKVIGRIELLYNTGTSTNPILFANNFLSTLNFSSILKLENDQYMHFFNNSILDSGSYGGGNWSSTVNVKNSSNITFTNNILSDKAYGILFYLDYGNTNIISNNNDYHTNGYYGQKYTSSTPASTLFSWQSMSGMETNSISINPGFFSSTDLHISNPAMNNTGVPLSAITMDIDGETRPPIPDMGADESNFGLIDAGLISLHYKSYEPDSTCGYTPYDSVAVRVKNFGVNTIHFTNDSMILNLNITGPVNSSYQVIVQSDSLEKDSIRDFLIASIINIPLGGTYSLSASLSINADSNLLNNQSSNYFIKNYKIESLPYLQTFEGFNESESMLGNYNNDYKEGWGRSFYYDDSYHWLPSFRVKKGAWYNTLTGPGYDHTTLSSNGKWISPITNLDTSTNKTWSPCIDFNGVQHPMLSFWYHMFGPDLSNDTLFVDVNNGSTWDLGVFYLAGQQQSAQQAPWLQAVVDLQAYANMQITLRFRVEHTSSNNYPKAIVAIDDVLIDEVPIINLGNDTSICMGDTLQIGIIGQNGHSYEWRQDSQSTVISTGSFLNVYQAGTYNLRASNVNGLYDIDTITIVINTLPIPYLGSDTSICDTSTLVLSLPMSYLSYLWQDSSQLSHFVVNPGIGDSIFWVQVEDNNHCFGFDTIFVLFDTCLNIDSYNDNQFSLDFYPNPARKYFYLKTEDNWGEISCIISNSEGQQVYKRKHFLYKKSIIKINISSLSTGFYLIQVTNDRKGYSAKLIINK